MKLTYRLLGLLVWAIAFPAAAEPAAAQCPAVNCDCAAIADGELRGLCAAREAQVIGDCVANQGKPKTFCGVHGPDAFPVAVSLQAQAAPVAADAQDVETIHQLITTQSWSLDESFKALVKREKAQQFGDAIQVLNLLERDSERLHGLQKQVVLNLRSVQRANDAVEQGTGFANGAHAWAKQLRDYSEQLWRGAASTQDERTIKAYRAIALKSARLAAEVYEFGGDLYMQAGRKQESALAWQAAAEVAQSLIAWEHAGDNKRQHIEFYQAQAAARWHRATYLWSGTGNKAAVADTLARAAAVGNDAGTALVNAGPDTHAGTSDSRAIKRGSR